MIAFAIFLFAVLVVAWMVAPGGEREISVEIEHSGLQPETQRA